MQTPKETKQNCFTLVNYGSSNKEILRVQLYHLKFWPAIIQDVFNALEAVELNENWFSPPLTCQRLFFSF